MFSKFSFSCELLQLKICDNIEFLVLKKKNVTDKQICPVFKAISFYVKT